MKTFCGILLAAACLVACAHSLPRAQPLDTRGSFIRPVELHFPDASFEDSVEDPVSSWPGFFRSNPFDGWYSHMQEMIQRLRNRLVGVLSHIPEEGSSFGIRIPEGANTTSTTKIINGHVVTINETTYMDGDDEFKTLIRVRVIDVKPENETILATEGGAETVTVLPVETTTASEATNTEEERTTPARSIETVEDLDNEIPKNQVDTLTA